MTPSVFWDRMEFLVGIVLLAWFFYRPWRRLIVDISRHELLKIRDAIFLMAADGELDFNSQQYQDIREAFNGFIRYCHTFTLSKIIAAFFLLRHKRNPIAETLGQIKDEKLRTKLEAKWHEAAQISVISLMLRSPVLLLTMMATLPIIGAVFLLDYPWRKVLAVISNTIGHGLAGEMQIERGASQLA